MRVRTIRTCWFEWLSDPIADVRLIRVYARLLHFLALGSVRRHSRDRLRGATLTRGTARRRDRPLQSGCGRCPAGLRVLLVVCVHLFEKQVEQHFEFVELQVGLFFDFVQVVAQLVEEELGNVEV